MERYVRSFTNPDEVIEIETVRSEMISRDGMTVSHDIQRPGWRWSTHIRPIVGGEWCQVHHLGVMLRGRMGFRMEDGTEFHASGLTLLDVPPGHDAWVVGDEPVESISWSGVRGWLAPLESLSERILDDPLSPTSWTRRVPPFVLGIGPGRISSRRMSRARATSSPASVVAR
jgi:hypothetical protein